MQKTNPKISEIKFLAGKVFDSYQAHQAVWAVVGDSPNSVRHFHHDYTPLPFNKGAVITVRALSQYLPENAKLIKSEYETGETLQFSLGAAAVIIRHNNKEFPCLTHDELWNWISSRSAAHGFEVQQDGLEMDTQPFPVLKPGKHRFFLNRAYFTGVLKVTNSNLFAHALLNGIGRHKGLGFGMLKIINNNNESK